MTPTVDSLHRLGFLSPLDAHFARVIGRLGGDERPEVLLAAALASRQVNNGHVCLHLPELVKHAELIDDAGDPVAVTWPTVAEWLDVLRSSALVRAGDVRTPLVLDDAGRLYLRRYWDHQEQLAAAIHARATQTPPVDGRWLKHSLERLFPADPASAHTGEPDWQRIAAAVAAQRRFCVISGGPGTGKTYTVVKILALLVEQALHTHGRILRVTLVAPTGKAAARLSESIQRAKQGLACSEEVRHAIPEEAATIHRCLGALRNNSTEFRHNRNNPLITDLVLVDEASMVDLALMNRLVAAVPLTAPLILLGDKDQLASVEAGAVLGDICNTGAPRSYSREFVHTVGELTGDRLPLGADAPHSTGIWDCMVQLTHSYRYSPQSGIGALARAINAGDSAAALAILAADTCPDVVLIEPPKDGSINATLQAAVVQGFAPYLRQSNPSEQLRALERFRVLCAHRRGPAGVELANQQIEEILTEAGLIHVTGPYYTGRPIMVTRNDYQLNLFNGDVGIIVDPDSELAAARLETAAALSSANEGDPSAAPPPQRAALFLGPQGTPRWISVSRLPPHETVYAMSVHKSQGSEFDEVAVLLPPRLSPVLSRELLYTAVTRARQQVAIYAQREVLADTIARRIERLSGLRERLWDTPAATEPSSH